MKEEMHADQQLGYDYQAVSLSTEDIGIYSKEVLICYESSPNSLEHLQLPRFPFQENRVHEECRIKGFLLLAIPTKQLPLSTQFEKLLG